MGLVHSTPLEVNKEDNKGTSPAIVLKLDLCCNCEGCARKIKSTIRHMKGVESVNVDMAGNTVMVTGEVDPARVKERIEKKMKKKVKTVSPQVGAASHKKPKEVQCSTVVLKIPLHCQGCMDKIRRTVSKFKGVESAIPDASKDLVWVKGTMNVNELVPHLKQKFKREVDVVLPKKEEKSDENKDVRKEVKFEGVDMKEKGNNGVDGEKKKDGDKDMKKVEVKADPSKSVKFKGADNKVKGNNSGDGEMKKHGDKDMKNDEVNADPSKSVKFKGVEKKQKGNNGGDGEKMKDEVQADASKSVEVVNKMEYYGQNPFANTMPMYNQSYYNQDYGISTSNYGYENMGYANHGYATHYSNGPPPPPPMYMHDSRGLDAGMFSDENPNAACSVM